MTLDQKTSHKGKLFLNCDLNCDLYILSIDMWFVRIGQYLAEIQLFGNLESEGGKNKNNIEKTTFKVDQMKFLAMHINNPKLCFYISMVYLQNIFMEHDLYLIS